RKIKMKKCGMARSHLTSHSQRERGSSRRARTLSGWCELDMALLRCRRRFATCEADQDESIQEYRYLSRPTARNTPGRTDSDRSGSPRGSCIDRAPPHVD